MADPLPTEILDRYWQALDSGALHEASRLRRELEEQFASINASMDLLDELLAARMLMDDKDQHAPKRGDNGP